MKKLKLESLLVETFVLGTIDTPKGVIGTVHGNLDDGPTAGPAQSCSCAESCLVGVSCHYTQCVPADTCNPRIATCGWDTVV